MAAHDETVEKVARAIYEYEPDVFTVGPDGGVTPWDRLAPFFKVRCRDMARAAIAALGDGWRDIATAPRDGTRVLLMLRGRKPPEIIARWAQEWTTEEGDDAFEWVDDEDDAIFGPPTHWVALPPPPGAKP